MEFLGVNIGDNVVGNYRIELPTLGKDGKEVASPPDIPWSAQRVGQYLVLKGDPVAKKNISADNLIDKIAAKETAFLENQTSVLNGNKEVEGCICIGYMRLEIVMPETSWVTQEVAPWRTIETTVDKTDFIFATAYNVSLPEKAKQYQVHTPKSEGGQVHVEQICAYRLRAFFKHLSEINAVRGATVFNLKTMRVRGEVKFSGKSSSKSSLHVACNGCEGVWTTLKTDYPCLAGVQLVFD